MVWVVKQDCVKAFLSDCKHKVCVNEVSSSWVHLTSGIPKNTVLGLVLFVCFLLK